MQLSEIRHHITARRNRIFLLMEELRRLRIQQRLKVGALATVLSNCIAAFTQQIKTVWLACGAVSSDW